MTSEGQIVTYKHHFGYEDPKKRKEFPNATVLFLKCETEDKDVVLGDDAEECVWVTLDELRDYNLRPALVGMLKEMEKIGLF